ncbi:MAG TPA: hypothetical protein VNO70_14830, partial [Blastocatellia bacterium]|nr:hypothetical protein [Blastocatellia bacterium]
PNAAAAACNRTSRNLLIPFLAGLPVTAVMLITAGAIKNIAGGAGVIAAGAVVCLYLIYASTGVAGLATTIGRRLKSPDDAERPWKATLRGSITLELTWLLPILGWFLILPASVIIGAGAMTMSLFRLRPVQVTIHADTDCPNTVTGSAVTAGLP